MVVHLGTGPVLDGLRATSPVGVLAALTLTAGTTWCCARRWQVVAARCEVPLDLRRAVGAYYRSQFLNASLPGGVVGDGHRAITQGRRVGDLRAGVRSVVWDRAAGQGVQVLMTTGVLVCVPSPLRDALLEQRAGLVTGALVLLAVLALLALGLRAASMPVSADLRRLATRDTWPAVVLLSSAAVLGHVTVFVVAARSASADLPLRALVPIALLVLAAAALPTTIAGWGPREGVAAWAFAAWGLDPALGLTVAVAYGVLAWMATAPGGVLLLLGSRTRRPAPEPVLSPVAEVSSG